jgi:hypothetical protein
MFSLIRNRLGIPGIIAVIALFFAMAGGAWAAKKYVITSTNQIKPSVLKSLQGKTGPAGTAGPAGPAGAAGPKGDTGAKGAAGAAGAAGSAGSAGATGATGATGDAGATGPEGVCSTAGCTLPKGVTLKGTWSIGQIQALAAAEPVFASIPFTIQVSANPAVFYMKPGETEDGGAVKQCKGGPTAPVVEPISTPVLCVWASSETNWTVARLEPSFLVQTANKSQFKKGGAVLEGKTGAAGPASAFGTWALANP